MRLLSALFIVTLGFAGCASLFAEPTTGMDNLSLMQGVADAQLDDPVFLGMAALDGKIDLDRFEEMSKDALEEEGEDPGLFDTFEWRYQNGEYGDGKSGAWFGAFAEADEERLLLVQVVNGATKFHIFDFEEDYEEVNSDPVQAGPFSMLTGIVPTTRTTSTSSGCEQEFASTVPAGIDSDRAAKIAHQQPEFHNHTESIAGDYVYVYIPQFTECWADDVETFGPFWGIAHLDADKLFEGEEPSVAYVVIDAVTEEVLEAGVEVPTEYAFIMDSFTVEGELLPPPLGPAAHYTYTFTLPQETQYVYAYIEDSEEMDHWLTDPDGTRWDVESYGEFHVFDMESPAGGTWTLHSTFQQGLMESRTVDLEIGYWYPKANAEE